MAYIEPNVQTDLNTLSAAPSTPFSSLTFRTRQYIKAAKDAYGPSSGTGDFASLSSSVQTSIIANATALATS